MTHASNLRDNAAEWLISECPKRAEWAIAAADRIEQLEAALRRIVESGAYPEATLAAEALDGAS